MIETRQNKVCQEFVIVFWVFRMFATMVIIIHPPHVGEMGMFWYNMWQMVVPVFGFPEWLEVSSDS